MHRSLFSLVVIAALSGCSTSETPAPSPAPASSSGTDKGDGTKTPDPGSPSDTTPSESAPKAPKLMAVEKMMGSLHVMWENTDDTCESVIGERKTASTDYVEAFTVPGEVDNKHDTAATGTDKYTYRLRCKKGDAFSSYSNEMSGTP